MTLYRHRCSGTTINGETFQFGAYSTGTSTLSSAEAAWSGAIGELFSTDVLALYATSMSVTDTSTATIDEATGRQQARVDTGQTLSGSSTSETLPPQIALVISLRSAMANRGSRGRFYLPAPSIDALASGRVDSTAKSTIVDATNSWWSTMDGGGLALTLWSPTNLSSQPITRGDVGDVWDTQRRRRDKLVETRTALTPPS